MKDSNKQKERIDAAVEAAVDAAALLESGMDSSEPAPVGQTIEQVHSPDNEQAVVPTPSEFVRDHIQVVYVGDSKPSQAGESASTEGDVGTDGDAVESTDEQPEHLTDMVNAPLPADTSLPVGVLPLVEMYAVSQLAFAADKVKNKKMPAGVYIMVMVPEASHGQPSGQGEDETASPATRLPAPQVYLTANDGQHIHIVTPDKDAAEELTLPDTRLGAQRLVAACARGEAPPYMTTTTATTDAAGVTWHRFNLFMPVNTLKQLMSTVKAADMKQAATAQGTARRSLSGVIHYTHTEQARSLAMLPASERRGGTGMFKLVLADGMVYPLLDAEHFGTKPDSVDQYCRIVMQITKKACIEYQPFADLTDERNLLQGRASPLDAHTTPATLSSVLIDMHKHLLKFDKGAVMMQLATAHRACDVNTWASEVSVLRRSIVATTRYLPHTIHNVIDRDWTLPGQ